MIEVNHNIFTQRGSLGDCAIIDREIGEATINPSMVLMRDINCNPRFLYYILIGDEIQREVLRNSTSAVIPMLSQKQIKEFPFLNPKSEEQQKKMKKYKNKYRIPSARAPFWDYGWNAAYFVTICTQNREYWFGNVVNGEMELSAIGHIANSCWYEIPNHFPFVELGAYIIMPNHVHGIIIINKPDDERNGDIPNTDTNTQQPKNQFGPQSQNLASIIRGFKIGVTKNARQINSNFTWQSRYHDHIIRDEKSFQTISNYIRNNPANWQGDKFYNNI